MINSLIDKINEFDMFVISNSGAFVWIVYI